MLKPKVNLNELPGFEVPSEDAAPAPENEFQNSKKKKKGSGGFQSMGLSFPVLKGITKRGYKQPTPIQRKTIPLALENKDVVAMARTGSGKTACFVLPILDKLLAPTNKATPGKNLRALILSPTRELALQTLKFVRELGKFTGLSSAAILGGESIEQQFSVMSGKAPDIVVATPGRFLHICIEMELKLDNIKVIVFDEADRLFELGFGEQLREIVARLPSSRQTLLFSATLPKMLVEFAKAGLTDPVLIRLDVDWKLPSTLWLGWIYVRAELKTAALLLLLDRVLTETTPQAVVFAATKHHVEYLSLILQKAGISSTYAYSGLDPSARKIALGRFCNQKCSVLLVTDVAARGLDLPALDTVINYNFPAKPKLFVHRVGRSARAGRAGRAWSLVAADDLAHLLDLQLFLGHQHQLNTPEQRQLPRRPPLPPFPPPQPDHAPAALLHASTTSTSCSITLMRPSLGFMTTKLVRAMTHATYHGFHDKHIQVSESGEACPSGVWGGVSAAALELRHQDVMAWEKNHSEIEEAARVCGRGWQQYLRWREAASADANRRAKLTAPPTLVHPFLRDAAESHAHADNLADQIKNYTPRGTILELGAKNDSPMSIAMKNIKHKHGKMVQRVRENKKSQAEGLASAELKPKKTEVKRDENYIPHQASDHLTETG
ncbi:hypothetical protein MSG28_003024 [Choristoneura fumiferana]|uniref:Uncharacterized protein n=1 Tax=Choristoneura fumiferana TaxID=7141 RepID=A0ACC0JK82_CHOFU|nr:hypothetical protein MSG28_003024 [Choristoneura fumiferana]